MEKIDNEMGQDTIILKRTLWELKKYEVKDKNEEKIKAGALQQQVSIFHDENSYNCPQPTAFGSKNY